MRIGYISTFQHDWNTESETAKWMERAGHQVDRWQYNTFKHNEFLRDQHKYDYCLTALPQSVLESFWEKVEIPKVARYYDIVRGWDNRDRAYVPALKHFDLVVSTDGFEDWYREHGIRRVWLPHGFDPDKYNPVPAVDEYKCDVAFIGHVYTASRRQLLGSLDKFDFRLYGQDNTCWGTKYAQICSSAKMIVGDNAVNSIPGYWSDRLYISLGCGAFLLYPNVPGIESQFRDGEHLVLYKDEKDLHKKIKYYLAHKEERWEIAWKGWEHAHRYHTIPQRVQDIEEILRSALLHTQIVPVASGCSHGNSSTVSHVTQSSQSPTEPKGKKTGRDKSRPLRPLRETRLTGI
jgi:hypothetical protein